MIYTVLKMAIEAHGEQRRKYTNEPYIIHPISVAQILDFYGFTERVQVAAILHDTLEDTSLTFKDIEAEFGYYVADLVRQVSDISKPEDGNRALRKAKDRAHYAAGSPEAQAIKVADLIDNTKTIVAYDKNFAKVYIKEKEELLKVLTRADSRLVQRAWKQIENYSLSVKE